MSKIIAHHQRLGKRFTFKPAHTISHYTFDNVAKPWMNANPRFRHPSCQPCQLFWRLSRVEFLMSPFFGNGLQLPTDINRQRIQLRNNSRKAIHADHPFTTIMSNYRERGTHNTQSNTFISTSHLIPFHSSATHETLTDLISFSVPILCFTRSQPLCTSSLSPYLHRRRYICAAVSRHAKTSSSYGTSQTDTKPIW